MNDLKKIYKELAKELNIANVHAVPRIVKVVLNVGVGKNRGEQQYIDAVKRDLAAITGQVPHERRATKAISGFKIRRGDVVGYGVTLRGKRMEDFIQKFVHVTLPRVRDFRGIPTSSIDPQGNLSVGLREHLAFPEIHPDKTDIIFGVEATFVTSSNDRAASEYMFRVLGFPFQSPDVRVEEPILQASSGRAAQKNIDK